MMQKDIEKGHPKYTKVFDLGSRFGASCLKCSRCGALFLQPVFRKLWGVPPWTDFGIPRSTLGPIYLTVWKVLGPKLLRISKIPEQHVDTSQTKTN